MRKIQADFGAGYIVDPLSGCWLWMGKVGTHGYGCIGSKRLAHREFYEHFVGPIPAKLHLDHLCSTRRCVNPKHLEPVTCRENLQRAWRNRPTCHRGHPWTEENTYHLPTGTRLCKACCRLSDKKRYSKTGWARHGIRKCRICGELRPHRTLPQCSACYKRSYKAEAKK